MFRPFSRSGEPPIDKVVADLTAVLAEVGPYSPEALKLAEVIGRLRDDDAKAKEPLGQRGEAETIRS